MELPAKKINVSPRRVWLLLGDSITELGFTLTKDGKEETLLSGGGGGVGWASRLQAYVGQGYDVVSRGIGGYNTRFYLQLVESMLAGLQCDRVSLVTIMFGSNDTCGEGHKQHVPLEEYEANLQKLVSFVAERCPHSKLLVLTPPPLAEEKWCAYMANRERSADAKWTGTGFVAGGERSLARVTKYAEAARRVVEGDQSQRVGLADVNKAVQEFPDWDAAGEVQSGCLSDGLHLNENGNRVAFDTVFAAAMQWEEELKQGAARASQGIPEWSTF